MVAKRGLVSRRSNRKVTALTGSKAAPRSVSTTCTIRSTRLRSIVVYGRPFDPHRRRAAPAAEQDVDDRIDQRGIDGDQTVVVPFRRLDDAQHRRQRHAVEVIAETDRGDAVERNLDVVGGEVAQAGRHQPDEPVEHHLEHRQTLVGNDRGVEDGLDAGCRGTLGSDLVEPKQAVDLVLVEDARRLSGFLVRIGRIGRIGLAVDGLIGGDFHGPRPLRGERVLVDRRFRRFAHDRSTVVRVSVIGSTTPSAARP